MGCIGSKNPYSGSKDELSASKKIDSTLRKDKQERENEIKLLLLGAGESGKSTFLKQMKIIHLKGFTDEERVSFKDIVHSNIIMAMRAIITAAEKLKVQVPSNLQEKTALFLQNEILYEQKITPEIAEAISQLWDQPFVKELVSRSHEFQLIDSAEYFFSNFERISKPEYTPTVDDLLRARARTTGITEITFDLSGVPWKMVDVGGQRSERKKWIHCFQDVTALIFCVAISEFDLKLYEDERVNRMHESITLFEEICNCPWFHNTSVVLFLNKTDLFEEKIKRIDMKCCFEDYTGGCNFEKAIEYLKNLFLGLNKNPKKLIYPHFTCATDTSNVRKVFAAVRDIIVRETLDRNGLL